MKQLRSSLAIPILMMLCWSLTTSNTAWAQSGTGTLTGTVTDAQGASLPGAVVTVTDQSGLARTAPSDKDGVFRFPGLPAGRYTLEATMSGFAPLKMTDIPLAPALEDLLLEVRERLVGVDWA